MIGNGLFIYQDNCVNQILTLSAKWIYNSLAYNNLYAQRGFKPLQSINFFSNVNKY